MLQKGVFANSFTHLGAAKEEDSAAATLKPSRKSRTRDSVSVNRDTLPPPLGEHTAEQTPALDKQQVPLPGFPELVSADAQGLHSSAKLLTALQNNPSLN